MKRTKGDWTDLFRTFRMSLDPRKLWLAFRGVVWSLVLLGLLLGILASIYHARGAPFAVDADVWGAARRGDVGGAVAGIGTFAGELYRGAVAGPGELPVGADEPVASPVGAFLGSRVRVAAAVTVLLALLDLALLWSYHGGAIMRIAAVEYALGERIELASAMAYAKRKHHCFYGAPLGLLAVFVLIGLAPLVGGLVARNVLAVALAVAGVAGAVATAAKTRKATGSLPGGAAAGLGVLAVTAVVCTLVARWGWRVPYVGEVLLGVVSPVLFVVGFVMVVIAIWCVAGAPLMAGAVASSDSDVFDAWSRAFHYVFTHPWRYVWYVLVASAYGCVAIAFAWCVRVAAEWVILSPIAFGLQGDFEMVHHFMAGGGPTGAGEVRIAPRLLAFFLSMDRFLLNLVFLSFVASYAATAKTVVYFLMRRCADGTPVSEVHLDPRDQEFVCPAPPAQEA